MTYFFFFFFSSRRRHTRWPRDWSSDVCSSDLGLRHLVTTTYINVTSGMLLPTPFLGYFLLPSLDSIKVTSEEITHVYRHMVTMHHLTSTPGQMFFEPCRTTAFLFSETVFAPKPGVLVLPVLPHQIFLRHLVLQYNIYTSLQKKFITKINFIREHMFHRYS